MKYVGIIAAMNEEVQAIKELMTKINIKKVYELEFITGQINGKDSVLVKCGVGKVNAARTTQILVDKFDLDYVINVGTAGSLNDELEIGDLIIADKLVQHDFDITGFGHEKGYISEVGKFLNCDKKLINKAKEIIEKIGLDFNMIIGAIATGDVFCTDINMKKEIRKEFNTECIEMEGASIAQVCSLDNIPFIVIRAISDKPNGKNGIDFETYLQMACERYAKFVDFFLK